MAAQPEESFSAFGRSEYQRSSNCLQSAPRRCDDQTEAEKKAAIV